MVTIIYNPLDGGSRALGLEAGFRSCGCRRGGGSWNIWKFPYITGENGGGAFVLIYLACIAGVGLPVMMAEILLGRATQKSPVGAIKALGGGFWVVFGGLGILGGVVILSYYSVVAGWAMHYTYLALSGQIAGLGPEGVEPMFGALFTSNGLNLFWHVLFMIVTIGVVWGGVNKGIERWARILMPVLFGLMLILLVNAFTMDGFGQAFDFVFGFHTESLTAAGVLEALGHAFFTLSVGMGAMLTYGSYLGKQDDIVSSAITISVLDTLIALIACMILFPITFSYGMEPANGPGLVFVSIPIALSQMPAGSFFAFVFFALLVFAALTSAISVVGSRDVVPDRRKGWLRHKATVFSGVVIALIGVPSALSGGTRLFGEGFAGVFGMNWFDSFDYLASNWILPLGGLGISLFTAWKVDDAIRHREFLAGSRLALFYGAWLILLKFVVPVGIVLVFLHAIGVI